MWQKEEMPLCPRTTVTGARRRPKCQKCNLLAKALQLHVNLNSTRRVKQGRFQATPIRMDLYMDKTDLSEQKL